MRHFWITFAALVFSLIVTSPLHADNLIESWTVDLNGDGINEDIEVEWHEGDVEFMSKYYDADFYYLGDYTVRINQYEVSGYMDSPMYSEIIDLDTTDGKSELVLYDAGPSDDYSCVIFGFNGKELYTVGEFPGLWDCDGDGDIHATTWQGFWTATSIYRLNMITHRIYKVEQPLYYVDACCNYLDGWNCRFEATSRIPLYLDQDSQVIVDNVEVGEYVTILAASPTIVEEYDFEWVWFQWYILMTDDGVLGWALEEDFAWSLDGLCFAD